MAGPEHLNGRLFEGSIRGGTPQLFPSAPLLTGRAKYPRGFTPERLREVQTATRMDPQKTYPPRAEDMASVRDTVARSTVPVEHLAGASWYPGSSVSAGHGSYGQYNARGQVAGGAQIHISPGPGPSRGGTPIHEIGHHVSHLEETPHSAYDTAESRGREEAYAENYADTHFRDRRGRPVASSRKSDGGNEWTKDYDAQSGGHFRKAFREERQKSPVVQADTARKASARDRILRPTPPGTTNHVPGQERLLDRTTNGPSAYDSQGNRVEPKPHWNYVWRGEDDPDRDPKHQALYEERRRHLDAIGM